MVLIHTQYIVTILVLCGTIFAVLTEEHSFLAQLHYSYEQKGIEVFDIWISMLTALKLGKCFSFVGGFTVMRYGGAKIFGIAVAISGLMNLLIPTPHQDLESWPHLVKFVHGVLHGFIYCAIIDIWTKLALAERRTTLIAVTATSEPLTFLVIQFSSYKVHLQLRYFHHIIGIIAMIWAIVWILYVRQVGTNTLNKRQSKYVAYDKKIFVR